MPNLLRDLGFVSRNRREFRLPRGHIDGYVTSNDTDTAHDISFAAGECRDSTNTVDMLSTSAIVKQIDADWAEGTDAGGFPDTALNLADTTWYHLFVIATPGGKVDAGFDTSVTAANLLDANTAGAAGYTYYRRVGSVYTVDSGGANYDIQQYTQFGDHFVWHDPTVDVKDTTLGATEQTSAIRTPLGVSTFADLSISFYATGLGQVHVIHPNVTDVARDTSEPYGDSTTLIGHLARVGSANNSVAQVWAWTDTSSQVSYRSTVDSATRLNLQVNGWIDPRGRDA